MKSKAFFKGTGWKFTDIDTDISDLMTKVSVDAINTYIHESFYGQQEDRATLSFAGAGSGGMATGDRIFINMTDGDCRCKGFPVSLGDAFEELIYFGAGSKLERKKFLALAANLEKWAGQLREKVTEFDEDVKADQKREAIGVVEG